MALQASLGIVSGGRFWITCGSPTLQMMSSYISWRYCWTFTDLIIWLDWGGIIPRLVHGDDIQADSQFSSGGRRLGLGDGCSSAPGNSCKEGNGKSGKTLFWGSKGLDSDVDWLVERADMYPGDTGWGGFSISFYMESDMYRTIYGLIQIQLRPTFIKFESVTSALQIPLQPCR
jgi:hypothetical protein